MEKKYTAVVLWFVLLNVGVVHMEADKVEGRFNSGGILSSLASTFLNKGFITTRDDIGTSQIVSLNINNLLLLFLLKAVIFAAGTLGAKHFKGGEFRTIDEDKFLTEAEVLLYLSYLTGSTGCLQKIACEQPEQATMYASAGDFLLKLSEVLSIKGDVSYQTVLKELERASNLGLEGKSCDVFVCGKT